MISAKLALEYNRDTFALVPSNGFSKAWEGNKELIYNSAAQKLIEPSDLKFFLGKSAAPIKPQDSTQESPQIPEKCKSVYELIIRQQIMTPYDLALKLNERTRVIRTRLFIIELLRLVRRIPGDRYILA